MSLSKKLMFFLAAIVAVPALATDAGADALPASMPCELEVEKTASAVIFELQLVMGRKNALSTHEFSAIRQALDTLENHGNSELARSCFRSYPDQKRRYSLWLQQQGGALAEEAQQRLDATCTRRTQTFIHSHQLRIDAAVRDNRLALAARYATAMRAGLDSDPMIARCAATAEEVAVLRNTYLPGVMNQAAIPTVRTDMALAYWSAKKALDGARTAIATTDRNLTPVDAALEAPAGQSKLRAQLERCRDYGQALRELGAPADLPLASAEGQVAAAQEAAEFCAHESADIGNTLQAVAAHNVAYRAIVLERWQRVSIKGFGMERVFTERGRPQAEKVLGGGAIVWNYQEGDSCTQVRFTPRGKLMTEAKVRCPAQSSAESSSSSPSSSARLSSLYNAR